MDEDSPICGIKEIREHMLIGCDWNEAVWFGVSGIR